MRWLICSESNCCCFHGPEFSSNHEHWVAHKAIGCSLLLSAGTRVCEHTYTISNTIWQFHVKKITGEQKCGSIKKLETEYSFQNKINQRFFFLFCSLSFTSFTLSLIRYLAWNSWGNWNIGCDHQCIRNCYYIWLHPTFCLRIQIWPLCKSRKAEWEVRLKFIYFFWSIL